MKKIFRVLASALLISVAHAGYFSEWQNIYVTADDGKAYDFYANGKLLCSGKRCHYTNSNSDCKIEFMAKKNDRIYGIKEFGDDYVWEQRSFLVKLLLDKRDKDKPCTSENATVHIDPAHYIKSYLPDIKNTTKWSRPMGKELQEPRSYPSRENWKVSPFRE